MKVIIAEKPSVAKAIAKFFGATKMSDGCILGDGVAVTWCFGHLFEQAMPEHYDPKFKSWRISDLPIAPVKWALLPREDAKKQIGIIGELLKNATSIVHAGDPDREGQLLVDEVIEHFKRTGLPVDRLWLAAMDDESIKTAIGSMKPGAAYANLKLSAESRGRADWVWGLNLTRAWTKHGQKAGHDGVLSVGRVQTPTLALIVARDNEIDKFKSRDFFEVEGAFPFAANWKPGASVDLDEEGRLLDKKVADAVAAKINGQPGKIDEYVSKKGTKAAPLPHSLSTLQQRASAKFGLSAQQTLDIAQALYETHKCTTYPRTDSQYLPNSMQPLAAGVLQSLGGEYGAIAAKADVMRKSAAFNDKKIIAHHAIIPTGKGTTKNLSEMERKVYDLIVRAYASQFYPDHTFQQVNVTIACAGEKFTASGKTVISEGWKTVYGADDEDDDKKPQPKLPALVAGGAVTCSGARVISKKTTPSKRYTDGTLVGAMTSIHKLVTDPVLKAKLRETDGIGTVATRANIIETLVRRRFVEKNGKNLISTETGKALIAALGSSEIVNAGNTGVFEGYLDNIAQGKMTQDAFMSEIMKSLDTQIGPMKNGTAPRMIVPKSPPKVPGAKPVYAKPVAAVAAAPAR